MNLGLFSMIRLNPNTNFNLISLVNAAYEFKYFKNLNLLLLFSFIFSRFDTLRHASQQPQDYFSLKQFLILNHSVTD